MKNKLIIILAIALLLTPGVLAQSSREEAELALVTSEQHIQEMIDAGFSVFRVNDTLEEAQQILKSQIALEDSGGEPDYELVTEKTDDITELKRNAFYVHDEINALQSTLGELGDINITAVQEIIDDAKVEFQDERYDQASDYIEDAYEKISEEQAFSTKVSFFFETTRKNIVTFLATNWIWVTSSAIIIVILFVSSIFLFVCMHNKIS